MELPAVLKNFNMFLDGVGHAGKCDQVKLPVLKIKTDEHRSGGMDMSADMDMGMEKMELGFTLAEHAAVVFKGFGLRSGSAVQATFRAALVGEIGNVVPYVISCRGRYTEINPGSPKAGDKAPLEATLNLRYYRLDLNGETLIEIDVENMIRVIDGVDQLAEIRKAIGV